MQILVICDEVLLFSKKAFPLPYPMLICTLIVNQSLMSVYYFGYILISPELRERFKAQKNGGQGKGRRPEAVDGLMHPLRHSCHMTIVIYYLTSRTPKLTPISLDYVWKKWSNSQREVSFENGTLMSKAPHIISFKGQ